MRKHFGASFLVVSLKFTGYAPNGNKPSETSYV